MVVNLGAIKVNDELVKAMKKVKSYEEYADIQEQNKNEFEAFCAFMIAKEHDILDELIECYTDNGYYIDYVSSYFDTY